MHTFPSLISLCEKQSTTDMLDFILDSVQQKPTQGIVNKEKDSLTAITYDLNMNVEWILKDLDEQSLKDILKFDSIRWDKYKLRWKSKKCFIVEEFIKTTRIEHNGKVKKTWPRKRRRIEIVEAYGLFEKERYPAAAKTWKAKSLSDMTDKYINAAYRVMIDPTFLWGKGQLGNAWMRDNVDKKHYATDRQLSPNQSQVIKDASYGGRMQSFAKGEVGDVWAYDINSAYAAAMIQLPSLKDAKLRKVKKYDARYKHGIWRIRWKDNGKTIGPFPVGHRDDNDDYPVAATYPLSGEGSYHAVEVAAALRSGYDVKIRWGWVLDVKCREKPFMALKELYDERDRLKRTDPDASRILKWVPQGIYGKLAYKAIPTWYLKGIREVKVTHPNPWESVFWAGEITAFTRAIMLELAQKEHPVNIVTDCIYFRKPQNVKEFGKGLGGLKLKRYEKLWIARYNLWRAFQKGVEVRKAGGFLSEELDYDRMEENESFYGFPTTKYVDLRSALSNGLVNWREYVPDHEMIKYHEPELSRALGELS